ncbi:response regulator [Bdellovibrionota bacterium FG-1]
MNHTDILANDGNTNGSDEKRAPQEPLQSEPLKTPRKTGDRIRVLVIDDEEPIRTGLMRLLSLDGYDVMGAEHGARGMEVFAQTSPEVVITDIRMPTMDGIGVLKAIKAKSPATVVIMVTGHGDSRTFRDVLALGAFDYHEKPVGYEALVLSIKRGLGLV